MSKSHGLACCKLGCQSQSFLPPLCKHHYRETVDPRHQKLEQAAENTITLLQEIQTQNVLTGDLDQKLKQALMLLQQATPEPAITHHVAKLPDKPASGRASVVVAHQANQEVFQWLMAEYADKSADDDVVRKTEVDERLMKGGQNKIIKAFISILQQSAASRRILMLAKKYVMSSEDRVVWLVSQSLLVQTQYRLLSFTVNYMTRRLHDWTFDIFRWQDATDDYPLSVLCYHLMERHNLFQLHNISRNTFARWITAVEQGYLDNPYHNKLHGADVLRIMYFLCDSKEMKKRLHPVELLAAMLAAAVHDVGHPGTNNRFQCDTASDLAWTYNDQSVLENMHCATAFKLLREPGMNIFENWDFKKRKEVRQMIVEMVLATDMSHHFTAVHTAESRINDERMRLRLLKEHGGQGISPISEKSASSGISSSDADLDMLFPTPNNEEKRFILKLLIHTSDLAGPAENTSAMYAWAEGVTAEFHNQGDQERKLGLEVMAMMDRTKDNVEHGQIGFNDGIVKPLLVACQPLMPDTFDIMLKMLAENRAFWVNKLKDKQTRQREESLRPSISRESLSVA
eukprot:gb/GEZN01002227.1/.p1 GENE.gb/GEZN01002227.1/~~gb/GEZN01002227.1/.p1  ORF type:complete len:571 (-),score=78.88 gb/GEZN01002227.1/:561-2273(-)